MGICTLLRKQKQKLKDGVNYEILLLLKFTNILFFMQMICRIKPG
jgi:hypothetical protein